MSGTKLDGTTLTRTQLDRITPGNKERRICTGVTGLDAILNGGFPANHLYLVEGNPGTGKTTMALQYLLEGLRRGEKVLYVTLSETEEELRVVAESHGWSLDGMSLFETGHHRGASGGR